MLSRLGAGGVTACPTRHQWVLEAWKAGFTVPQARRLAFARWRFRRLSLAQRVIPLPPRMEPQVGRH